MILLKSSKRSLHDLVTGPCENILWTSWRNTVSRDLAQDIVSKILWVSLHDMYRSFWEDLVEIHGDPVQTLPKRRPCVKILNALHHPAQVLHRRSCRDPGAIFSKRSFHADLADAMSCRCLYESSCGGFLGSSCIKIL